jgi:hypothetical protein
MAAVDHYFAGTCFPACISLPEFKKGTIQATCVPDAVAPVQSWNISSWPVGKSIKTGGRGKNSCHRFYCIQQEEEEWSAVRS